MKTFVIKSVRCVSAFLCISILSSCASYRAVRIVQLTEKDTGQSETFYGIVKNNVLIPEFVVDEGNRYPTSAEDALVRFEKNKALMEPKISRKYKIPNSFFFQSERLLVGIGLMAISPVALPIHYIGGYGRDEEGRRSFSKTVRNYFDLSLNSVVLDETKVRNSLAVI
ncbi:MAG: hypothetical protein HY587_03715 [Candidatus Omnitrophica bacterium]|nr:hypothetical protein [Candidatus Omnitrophota bacterium]